MNSCFFLSFFRCWQKPQCNQVVLCFSCFPNKKTEQEVFVFGKKFFHFFISFIFIFFVDCSHFPPRSTVDFKPNFFSSSSTSLSFYMCFEGDQNFSFIFIAKVSARFFPSSFLYKFCLFIYTFSHD